MPDSFTRTILSFSAIAIVASAALADTIELKDGRKLTGAASRSGDQLVIKGDDGAVTSVPQAQVLRVTLNSTLSPADLARSEWTRALAEMKKLDDLSAVISLHQKFLEKYPDYAAAKDSLAAFQKLADSGGGVKFRGKWIAGDQLDASKKQWAQDARPALAAYQAGKMKNALELASALADRDPQNDQALTIAGLAAYAINSIPQARRFFAALAELEPASTLAQNNLAVIAWQQKLTGETFTRYSRALESDNNNRLLLDNITVALSLYRQAGGDPKSVPFKTLADAYAIAEGRMEAQLAKQGLKRVGGLWLNREEQEAANNSRANITMQMKKLELQFKAGNDALTQIDASIKQAQAEYDRAKGAYDLAAAQEAIDQQPPTSAFPNAHRGPNDTGNVYYSNMRMLAQQDLDRANRELAKLKGQRTVLQNHQADYHLQADKLTKDLADLDASLQGTQKMMDLPAPE